MKIIFTYLKMLSGWIQIAMGVKYYSSFLLLQRYNGSRYVKYQTFNGSENKLMLVYFYKFSCFVQPDLPNAQLHPYLTSMLKRKSEKVLLLK